MRKENRGNKQKMKTDDKEKLKFQMELEKIKIEHYIELEKIKNKFKRRLNYITRWYQFIVPFFIFMLGFLLAVIIATDVRKEYILWIFGFALLFFLLYNIYTINRDHGLNIKNENKIILFFKMLSLRTSDEIENDPDFLKDVDDLKEKTQNEMDKLYKKIK